MAFSGPLLATRQYGKGNFIYHGAIQPLLGYGGNDPSMYAYLIYRHAIEWAFDAANLPIIKLSPWQYAYDAAFIVTHDLDNDQAKILSINDSALFEKTHGAKGDYFFNTGTIRSVMTGSNQSNAIAGLQSAVINNEASIGSCNGGLQNPVVSLPTTSLDYWNWGPDEALDSLTTGTYANGKDYAQASILMSFQDIEGWLTGLDNGRAGCGSGGTCPRTWISPNFNSTREASLGILQELGSTVTAGEQKIGPFPFWTLSTQTTGTHYPYITLPLSDWYVGAAMTSMGGSIDGHTPETMAAAVDFYHNLGALTNIYGHINSTGSNMMGAYVQYAVAKPNMWAANAVGIYDWWIERSKVATSPSFTMIGDIAVSNVTIAGSTDTNSSVEIDIPNWSNLDQGAIVVKRNGAPAIKDTNYRVTGYGVKVKVGTTITSVEVDYTPEALNTISVSPTAVAGGNNSIGTVTLTLAAPINGKVISLSSNNASATVPATVTIPGLSTSATFTITTSAVVSSTTATISATYNGVTKIAALTVAAAPTVTAFIATSPSSTRDIPITSFTSSGGVGGVTGYRVTASAVPPLASGGGWTGTPPISYTVSSDGTYTLYPWVKDAVDTVSVVYGSPVTVVVDTVAPNAPSVSGTTPTNNTTPTWNWSSGGGGGNGTYRYKLDDSNLGSGSTTTTGTSYTPASALTSNATHTFYVQERDAAGNWSNSGSFAIVIDTAAPDTSIISQPTNPSNQTSASFTFTATEAGSTFACQIDGGAYSSCTSTKTYSGLCQRSDPHLQRACH